MTLYAYHASQEQFAPSELLKYISLAEKTGFTAISSSDHFYPWSERQGHSGFTFAWLGAAMQLTQLPFSIVNAPGQRYHPAIIAQAIATICEMFPGRFTVALGSGEALNEKITGDPWPPKKERNTRLLESYHIIKRLLSGETVTHHGKIKVEQAKLYTRPATTPLLLGAAVTKETAEWVGSWADGLITVSRPHKELKEVVDAFRKGGGEGKPMHLKVQLSYSRNEEDALMGAYDQWRTNIFEGHLLEDLWKTEHFDAKAENVKPNDLKEMVRISSRPEYFIELIKEDIALGFENIILHNVNRVQKEFIKDFGQKVLPQLKTG